MERKGPVDFLILTQFPIFSNSDCVGLLILAPGFILELFVVIISYAYPQENLQLANYHITLTLFESFTISAHPSLPHPYSFKSCSPLELISSRKESAEEQVHFIIESSLWWHSSRISESTQPFCTQRDPTAATLLLSLPNLFAFGLYSQLFGVLIIILVWDA